MGLFKDMMAGFATGFVSAAVESLQAGHSHGHSSQGNAQIEQHCRQLGWEVDEREGDAILLHFNDPGVGIRKVAITSGQRLMSFRVWSEVTMNPRQLPAEIMGYLLLRNSEMAFCAWQVFVAANGEAGFALAACTLLDGIDSAAFQFICQTMVKEMHTFETKMKAAGLL